MLDKTTDLAKHDRAADDPATAAEHWLSQFEGALAEPGGGLLKSLFHSDSHWRDVLAVTWDIQTFSGADAVLEALSAHAAAARPAAFAIDPARAAPRNVTRAGTPSIEAMF